LDISIATAANCRRELQLKIMEIFGNEKFLADKSCLSLLTECLQKITIFC